MEGAASHPRLRRYSRTFDVNRDGRCLMLKPAPGAADTDPHFVVVTNWFAELEARLAGR